MTADPTEKLLNIGIIAALAGGIYLAYKFFTGTPGLPGSSMTCPPGQKWVGDCEGLTGLPGLLCGVGGFVAGAQGVCVPTGENPPPVELQKDANGCIIGVQHYCDLPDRKCRDLAQACTPAAGCPDYTEWSPLFGKCIATGQMITCPDGSIKYPELCREAIPKCAESECAPGASMCVQGISKVCEPLGTGCEDRGIWTTGGRACDRAASLQRCPSGALVDLNNPPGITLDEACAGSEKKIITNRFYGDCMRALMNECPGPAWMSGECQEKARACETDNSLNALATPAELAAFTTSCRNAGYTAAGLPIRTPVGVFNSADGWCAQFGHTLKGTIVKGFDGGEFPGSSVVFCYKEG